MGRSVMCRCLLIMFFCMLICYAMAQQSTLIHGVIKDSTDGKPIAGAVIHSIGNKVGVITAEDGTFSIRVPLGGKLNVSHVSFNNKTVVVDGAELTISLGIKSTDQEGVVVVAMDMKRKPRELGYSVQTIGGDEIKNTQRENFINGLQGRVAGLTINTTGGMAGSSSQIVLRGFNSASLSNQPLFVIDGIIMDNSTFDEADLADDRPNRTNDYTNRAADINPSDIASITVLKGPEATALYGSQASSGAIVITTKRASGKGFHLNYDNSFRWSKVTRFPKTIDGYAPGVDGTAAEDIGDANDFTYFGPAYASGLTKYDNIHNFFKTGFSNSQNIAADFGNKVSAFRFSSNYFDNTGSVPNNKYERYTFKLSNTTHIGKKIDINPAVTFAHATTRRPMKGSGGFILGLLAWPTTDNASDYQDESGNKRLIHASDVNSELYDNPFFSANRNYSGDKNRRLIANVGVDYRPTDWLAFAGRFGYDTYKTDVYILTDPQSSTLASSSKGYLSNAYETVKNYNHTITGTAHKQLGKFSTRLMLGTMWQNNDKGVLAKAGNNLVDADNLLSHSTDSSNIGTVQSVNNRYSQGLPDKTISRLIAYFGEASIGYDNKAFITYSHRFESASVFPKKYRNYNYPGISASVIISDIFPSLKGSFLNFWKLRASRAQTARLMTPYSNQSTFVFNYASSTEQAYSYSYYNNNPNLKPETQKTYEIGTEIKMLHNRISLEAAYYNTHNINQISVGYRASYGTGYILNTQNATESRNQGVELTLNIKAIESKDFDWNINFNFNRMWSNVLAIPSSIADGSDYYISDTWTAYNTRGGFVKNYPTTELTGYSYQRNNNGEILINSSTGLPLINTSFKPIGDRNPKFKLGTTNSFRYKNFSLSFLWDLRVGGDVFNATNMFMTYIGRSPKTADRMVARVIKGVLSDGNQNTSNPTQNTISVTPYNISSTYYNETSGMPDEAFIEKNINWLRLRDVTFSYNLPQNLIRKVKVLSSLNVFATANELFLFTNYSGADPDVNGNNASTKGVGGYGIDYGNVAAPISVNVGLKATF